MSRRAFSRCASASLMVCFAATAVHAANHARSFPLHDILLPITNTKANNDAIDVDGDGGFEL